MAAQPEPDITFFDAIEAYCDRLSQRPGATVGVHVSTRAAHYDITVERWGTERRTVWSASGLKGRFTPPPPDADSHGCRWPVTVEIPIGEEWESGFYLVTVRADDDRARAEGRDVARTGFVVRTGDGPEARAGRSLLVLATNTWNAYNTWGGSSLYTGGTQVAFARPWSRGMLDRDPTERDDRKAWPARWGEEPDPDGERFQEYRLSRGYSAAVGSSGWYQYERRFVEWAEGEDRRFDYAVSTDLEQDPSIADGYELILGIGHDEYWSGPQRDVVEAHVRRGGRYVSLSGNTMFWQVRVEPVTDTGRSTMVCHKYSAHETDPVMAGFTVVGSEDDGRGIPDPGRMTGMWADPVVGRPEAAFLGGSSVWGLYNRFGRAVRRGSGAFTVYRPDHWLLAGTNLGYGDLLGARHGAVGYETLGCRIQFDEFQQPVRAGDDGTPDAMEIVAFCPASNVGAGEYPKSISALSDQGDLEFIAQRIHGDLSPDSLARARNGTAIVAEVYPFGPDAGSVVTVGTTDWVFGLVDDESVIRVTANALDGPPR